MKGLTFVTGILLILLIAFVIQGIVILFLSDIIKASLVGAKEEAEIFGSATPFVIENVNSGNVYVRNVGANTISSENLAVYVDNKIVEIGAINLTPGVTVALNLSDGILASGSYSFKITSPLVERSETITVPKANAVRDASFGEARLPVNVMLVIDNSGSMRDDCGPDRIPQPGETPCKINDAKNASTAFIDLMNDRDKVGMVNFSRTVTVKKLTFDKMDIKDAIDKMYALGGTNTGDAIANATEQLIKDAINANRVQVLLTDGISNFGSDPLEKAQEAAAQNIVIYTIGLGSDVNQEDLKQIASLTGGKYYFASIGTELRDIFVEIGEEIGANWVKVGNSYIGYFGSSCLSSGLCAFFNETVYPDSNLYQNVRIVFPGAYNIEASVNVFTSGSVSTYLCGMGEEIRVPGGAVEPCLCPALRDETCAANDARVRLIALDISGNILGEKITPWAGALGTGWVHINSTWTTPAGTKTVRLQLEPGDCSGACSASVYTDDAYMTVSKP